MMIVDETLFTKAEELKTHLESQGQTVEMVKYQDLTKEYTDGEYSTGAMHEYAKERWKTAPINQKPKYLTLIGSGNFNTKGLWDAWYSNELPLIPSKMLRTNESIKASAADWELSKITDDIYPDISVGRLDAGTATELGHIIDKIVSYENLDESTLSDPKALCVTDHEPTFDLYQFDGYMEGAVKSFESPWNVQKLYRTGNTPAAMTSAITNALNTEQVNLLLYNGHGSWTTWGKDLFYNTSQLGNLNQNHFLPVIVEANCTSSDFYHAAYRSMGTLLMQKEKAGAVAIIGNTTITKASSKSETFQDVVDNLLRRGYPRVGEALLRAKIENLVNDTSDKDQSIACMHLLGVPSLKLKTK